MNRFLLALGLLVFVPLVFASAGDTEKEFPTSPAKKLDVDLKTGGAITIVGWDKDVVAVKARVSGRNSDKVSVTMEPRESGFSSAPSKRLVETLESNVEFEISVPRKYDLNWEQWEAESPWTASRGRWREDHGGRTSPSASERELASGNHGG